MPYVKISEYHRTLADVIKDEDVRNTDEWLASLLERLISHMATEDDIQAVLEKAKERMKQ